MGILQDQYGVVIDSKIRVKTQDCLCDTFEKGFKCPNRYDFEHCSRIKYEDFNFVSSLEIEEGDHLDGTLDTDSKVFTVTKNVSLEQRLRPKIEQKTFEDKLQELVKKYSK